MALELVEPLDGFLERSLFALLDSIIHLWGIRQLCRTTAVILGLYVQYRREPIRRNKRMRSADRL
jgi:hypothetical protein